MRILDLAFSALHLFPAPGMVNPMAIPDVIKQVQASQYQVVARDELRAINEARAQRGLPPIDQNGQTQGVNHVHQAR